MIAKTKKQVLLLILVPLVLPLVIAASYLWMKREMAGAVQMQQAAREVEKNVLGMNQAISHYLLHPEERPRVQFRLLYGRLTESLSRLQPGTEQERELITHMQWERETIGSLFPVLTGQGEETEAKGQSSEASEQRERVVGQLLISSEEIWLESFRLVKLRREKMAANLNEIMAISLAVVLLSGTLIVLLAAFIGRGIVGTQKDLEREIEERRQAEEALQKARDELEVRVVDRTRQLSEEIEEHKRTEESLRETQEELRLLSSRIMSAQENERRKIAGELHDRIWQILNRVILETNQLLSATGTADATAVQRAAGIILEDTRVAIQKIRSLQGELWPPVLDDLGILATFSWYLRRFEEEQPGIRVEPQIELAEDDVPLKLKIVIYRVLQESLGNVARHSGAARVRVSLKKDKGKIELEIEDDGKGFDLEQVLFGPAVWLGFGLVAIKEKIEHSGGSFNLQSRPGSGTTLQASWRVDETQGEGSVKIPARPTAKELERFQDMTQAISDWVYAYRIEPEGRFVPEWITPGFTEVTGYALGDLFGKTDLYWDLFPEDLSLGEKRLQQIRALKPYLGEFRLLSKNGAVHWIRDYCNPTADPFQPGAVKVIGATQDITARKSTENLIKIQHDLLLAAADVRTLPEILKRSLEAALAVSDMDYGGIYLIDEAGGLRLAQSIGLPDDFLEAVRYHPADANHTKEVMTGIPLYGRLSDVNTDTPEAVRRLDLRAFAVIPIRHEQQIIGCLNVASGTAAEVAEHHYVSLETMASTIGLLVSRAQAQEALLTSAEQYRRLFLANPSPMFVFDEETLQFLAVNAAAVRHYGWSAEEFLAQSILDIYPPEDRDIARDIIRWHRGIPETQIGVVRHCRKDGSVREIEISASFVAFAGRPGRFCTINDITERKQAEVQQSLLADILQILNQGGDLHSLVAETLRLIRDRAGFDAVGVRLRQGEEVPYFEQNGFSQEFLQEENFLCERGGDGVAVRDAEGRVQLECTCGLILSGGGDPSLPGFTAGGSFWTNASSDLLALSPETDPRSKPRNRCLHDGYQSVGLFPIRSDQEIIGLLQLNDHRGGRFTPGSIAFYETLAQNIGLALQRALAEEALRESERQYRLLFAANPNPMYVFDEETLQFLSVNEAAVRHYGWSTEEFLALSILDIRPPEDRPAVREVIKRHRGSLETPLGEFRHSRKDGTVMEMEVSASSIAFAGRPGRLCAMNDVTERNRIDRELREQQEWLRVTLTSIGDAVIASDMNGRITFINPVAEGLTGWKAAKALGRPLSSVFSIVNEQTGEEVEDPVQRALREGRPVVPADHTTLLTLDGGRVPIEDSAAPIVDSAGRVIGAVLVFHDVSGKRRAEETLIRLARFPEENPSPVLRIAGDGSLQYANESARTWLSKGWVWQVDTPLPEPFAALLAKAAPGRVVEDEITCRAGRTFWMTAVHSANEDYTTIYGKDITDRKRAEMEIRRNLAELKARNEDLDRFNRAAVDRELRMIELKKQINELCALTGQPARYKLEFDAVGR